MNHPPLAPKSIIKEVEDGVLCINVAENGQWAIFSDEFPVSKFIIASVAEVEWIREAEAISCNPDFRPYYPEELGEQDAPAEVQLLWQMHSDCMKNALAWCKWGEGK